MYKISKHLIINHLTLFDNRRLRGKHLQECLKSSINFLVAHSSCVSSISHFLTSLLIELKESVVAISFITLRLYSFSNSRSKGSIKKIFLNTACTSHYQWGCRPDYLCEVHPNFETYIRKSWPLRNMNLNYSRGCSIITKYQKLPVKHIKTKQIMVINYSFCIVLYISSYSLHIK